MDNLSCDHLPSSNDACILDNRNTNSQIPPDNKSHSPARNEALEPTVYLTSTSFADGRKKMRLSPSAAAPREAVLLPETHRNDSVLPASPSLPSINTISDELRGGTPPGDVFAKGKETDVQYSKGDHEDSSGEDKGGDRVRNRTMCKDEEAYEQIADDEKTSCNIAPDEPQAQRNRTPSAHVRDSAGASDDDDVSLGVAVRFCVRMGREEKYIPTLLFVVLSFLSHLFSISLSFFLSFFLSFSYLSFLLFFSFLFLPPHYSFIFH